MRKKLSIELQASYCKTGSSFPCNPNYLIPYSFQIIALCLSVSSCLLLCLCLLQSLFLYARERVYCVSMCVSMWASLRAGECCNTKSCAGRWIHDPSGRVYNVKYNPPRVSFSWSSAHSQCLSHRFRCWMTLLASLYPKDQTIDRYCHHADLISVLCSFLLSTFFICVCVCVPGWVCVYP